MKVLQILPSLSFGDAIGNDTLAINKLLISHGYETGIYAGGIHQNVKDRTGVYLLSELPKLEKNDVIIYHLATSSTFHDELPDLACKKIAIYHNVTPPEFFIEYNPVFYYSCKDGLDEVRQLRGAFDYCLAVSDYNKKDLIRYGYKCPIDIRPILIPFSDYEKTPSKQVVEKFSDGKTNIVFVGRIVPNKKFEDVIAAFSCYKKCYDSDARLILVGSSEGMEVYQQRLESFVDELGAEDVIFTGKIPFDEILAYYKTADALLCMSEHEGFCVPLIEAMFFDVPIIAYASSAIPYTLADSGVLLHEKNPLITAGLINRVVNDKELKDKIIAGQRERIKDFSYEIVSEMLMGYLKGFVDTNII